jgi:hypothetical protein
MSLRTDIIFVKALSSNSQLVESLPARGIYNTSIPLPDAEMLNAAIPYIIVRMTGVTNDASNKDEAFEGESDTVNIEVEICAETRTELGEMAEDVRTTIREYFEDADPEDEDYGLVPVDYQFGATAVMYDPDKPCFYQSLTYQCDTNA